LKSFFFKPYISLYLSLQRFSPILFLFFYLTALVSRFRFARFLLSFSPSITYLLPLLLPLFVPLPARLLSVMIEFFFFFPKGRKLLLSGYKVDKTVSRLRYGWCQRYICRFRDDLFRRFPDYYIITGYRKCNYCKRGHYPCKDVSIRSVFSYV
jgi:hypothetical protein